jgi:hypothetical protein
MEAINKLLLQRQVCLVLPIWADLSRSGEGLYRASNSVSRAVTRATLLLVLRPHLWNNISNPTYSNKKLLFGWRTTIKQDWNIIII